MTRLSPGVSGVVLSTDKEGANKSATFAPSDTVFLSADINVEKGTSVDIKWYALNVDGQDPAVAFLSNNVVVGSEPKLFANAKVDAGFPVGNYRVEVETNGTKAAEAEFSIQ